MDDGDPGSMEAHLYTVTHADILSAGDGCDGSKAECVGSGVSVGSILGSFRGYLTQSLYARARTMIVSNIPFY